MESGKPDKLNGERKFFRDYGDNFTIRYLDGSEDNVKLLWIGRYTMLVTPVLEKAIRPGPFLVYKHAITKLLPVANND